MSTGAWGGSGFQRTLTIQPLGSERGREGKRKTKTGSALPAGRAPGAPPGAAGRRRDGGLRRQRGAERVRVSHSAGGLQGRVLRCLPPPLPAALLGLPGHAGGCAQRPLHGFHSVSRHLALGGIGKGEDGRRDAEPRGEGRRGLEGWQLQAALGLRGTARGATGP